MADPFPQDAPALRWTAATAGSWHLVHGASAIFRLVGGTRVLVDAIADDVRATGNAGICLDSPVRSISHDADGASVTYGDGHTVRARRVIVTLGQNLLDGLGCHARAAGVEVDPRRARAVSQGVKACFLHPVNGARVPLPRGLRVPPDV